LVFLLRLLTPANRINAALLSFGVTITLGLNGCSLRRPVFGHLSWNIWGHGTRARGRECGGAGPGAGPGAGDAGVTDSEQNRKRVIGIMAAILASLHMRTADDLFGGPQGSPRTDKLIEASIMRKVDTVCSKK
jgi:hypothetical protein